MKSSETNCVLHFRESTGRYYPECLCSYMTCSRRLWTWNKSVFIKASQGDLQCSQCTCSTNMLMQEETFFPLNEMENRSESSLNRTDNPESCDPVSEEHRLHLYTRGQTPSTAHRRENYTLQRGGGGRSVYTGETETRGGA